MHWKQFLHQSPRDEMYTNPRTWRNRGAYWLKLLGKEANPYLRAWSSRIPMESYFLRGVD